ncbi:glycine oxidase ThiO [Inquilinus limosus]
MTGIPIPSPSQDESCGPTPLRGARPRVAIIGAGVNGLAIGWRLARAGCPVEVYDRGPVGREASWAAAGMLAAGLEAEPGEEALFGLCRRAQELWPGFAREVEAASGLPVGYRDEGTLAVALTRDDAAELRFSTDFQTKLGVELRWLSGAELLRREPMLRPGLAAAVHSPADHQVDNRWLVPALAEALRRAGGGLHDHAEVEAVTIDHGRAIGVVVAGEARPADVVVLAAGAWSGGIAGIPREALPPVRPVKGQMLALQMDPAAPLLRHVVWAGKAYLVPRIDGRLIVGATVEERGFDTTVTAGGMLSLLDAAWRALPGIEELPVIESWAGLRPGSRDDAPILGPSVIDGLVFATGHHRNGILLLPATVEAVAGAILDGRLPTAAEPFRIDRFTGIQEAAQ